MTIAGLQALSLLDYPGKPCSIVFTQGCVFRCSFCHNPELIPLGAQGTVSKDALFATLRKNKKMVDAVCITGGEPTLQRDLVEFICELKEEGFFVKLDTSGIRPDIVSDLLEKKKVDYIAMDLKAPWAKYAQVTNNASEELLEACKKTFSLVQESGINHEFRTTILPGVHCENDFFEICSYLKDGESYFLQATSFTKNLDPTIPRESGFSNASLLEGLASAYPRLILSLR